MNLEERLEHQIELVENDESLSKEEKAKEISELIKEARQFSREENESCSGSQWQQETYEKEGW